MDLLEEIMQNSEIIGLGEATGFFVMKKTAQKHGYHPLQHEPAFPDDKSRVDAGFSYGLALPPDS